MEVTPEFFDAWGLTAAAGDVFQAADLERDEPVLVLGSELGATLFEDGQSLGRQVLARNQLYRIIGVLEPTGGETDGLAFTPARIAAQQFQGFRGRFQALRTNLRFMVAEPGDLEEARAQLTNWFDSSHGVGAVAISVPREEAEATADRNSRLATVILFLALSALLIADCQHDQYLLQPRRTQTAALRSASSRRWGPACRQVFAVFFLEALIDRRGREPPPALGLAALLSRADGADDRLWRPARSVWSSLGVAGRRGRSSRPAASLPAAGGGAAAGGRRDPLRVNASARRRRTPMRTLRSVLTGLARSPVKSCITLATVGLGVGVLICALSIGSAFSAV